jgi:predicted NBD/HSP70 family sugar kinase
VSNYLCIDVGGTFIKYAYADHFGKISSKNKETTPATLDGFLAVIRKIVSKNIENIEGIAICCPGKVDRKQGTIFHGGSLPYLDGLPLKNIMEDEFRLPVGVINDGKAAALSELWLETCKVVAMVLPSSSEQP